MENINVDKEGYLRNLDDWTESAAQNLAAVIQQGTISSQRVVCAELKNLPAEVEEAKLKAPTLTIIGDVVSLRDKLAWFGEH